jgi:hypothetical protein
MLNARNPQGRVEVSRQRLKRTKKILEGAAVTSANLVGLAESANITIRQLCDELVWYHGLFERLNAQAAEGEKQDL